jgi:hypothetical protein
MTKEALKLALKALGNTWTEPKNEQYKIEKEAVTAIKEALAQPEQKYRRGNRLICLETEEYCVIHISGTDRQWVKFPDSHIGVYTNEQVSELFELLPKETEQKPVAWAMLHDNGHFIDAIHPDEHARVEGKYIHPLYTTPPQRKPLSDEEIYSLADSLEIWNEDDEEWILDPNTFARAIEAAHGIKE